LINKVGLNALNPASIAPVAPTTDNGVGAAQMGQDFASFLGDAIQNLDTQQQTVDNLNTAFVKGELSDVHQLTIASEKASLGLELTVQVRNKVIEAYQEIMRMQV
jgi:flagellar hook-basal body complex protein FliE